MFLFFYEGRALIVLNIREINTVPLSNNRNHLPIRRIVIFAVIAVIAIAGSVMAWRHFHPAPSPTIADQKTADQTKQIDYQPPTADQKTNGATIKENAASEPTTPPDQAQSSVNVLITSALVSSNALHIRSSIDTVSSSGTCSLKLENGAKVVTRDSDVQAMASSSTCKGFDIPSSELGTGTWKITLTYTNGSMSGSATMEKPL